MTDEELTAMIRCVADKDKVDPVGRDMVTLELHEIHRLVDLVCSKQREIDAALCLSAPVKTARQDMRDACANAIRGQE